jgi:hypothetical protein
MFSYSDCLVWCVLTADVCVCVSVCGSFIWWTYSLCSVGQYILNNTYNFNNCFQKFKVYTMYFHSAKYHNKSYTTALATVCTVCYLLLCMNSVLIVLLLLFYSMIQWTVVHTAKSNEKCAWCVSCELLVHFYER